MKTQNGVTLMIAAITIVILAILVGVGVNVGTKTYQNAKVEAYIQKMNMIQARVNVINAKIKEGDTSYNNIGIALENTNSQTRQRIDIALNGESQNGFMYYGKEQLEALGIANLD